MQAVILAGGFGTRLQPLTERLPKPMVPVVNRPILEYTIAALRAHAIDDLVILLYFQPQVIKDYFGDGSEFGVRIRYLIPATDMGSAGAVRAARDLLTDRFITVSGDIVSTLDLDTLVEFHEECRSAATMAIAMVPGPVEQGAVVTDAEGRVTALPDAAAPTVARGPMKVNAGICVFEPSIFRHMPDQEEFDFMHGLYPALLRAGEPLWGRVLSGYWADVRSPGAYQQVHQDYFAGRLELPGKTPPAGSRGIAMGYGARVARNVAIAGKVVIGANSTVQEGVSLANCVVGNNCVIEQGARLENAVLWNNVFIRRNVQVTGAVLADSVRVDRGARIEKGVVVASGSSVGAEAHIRENVKIWPYKIIEPGTTLASNLMWGAAARQGIFSGGCISGLTNVELTPEYMARLGAAYGSTFPQGCKVCISRDAAKSSRMLKRAFLGGVSSTGVDVVDLHDVPMPVAKYAIRQGEAHGGVHFQQGAQEPSTTGLYFFDNQGLTITLAVEKNIERLLNREDFRRVHFNEPGAIYESSRAWNLYRDAFLSALGAENIGILRTARFKVIVDFSNGPAATHMPGILAECGITLVTLNADPAQAAEVSMTRELDSVSKVVRALDADAGFLIHPDAEQLALVDGDGRVYEGVAAVMLAARLITLAGAPGKLATPVNLPLGLGLMARERNFAIAETKLAERAIAESAQTLGAVAGFQAAGKLMFPHFMPVFDAMYALVHVLALLARTGDKLTAAASRMPAVHWASVDVPVPGALKGSIVRHMRQTAGARSESTPDGIRLSSEDEWVLLVPDETRAAVHLFAESTSEDRAAATVGEYRNRVEGWLRELRGQ